MIVAAALSSLGQRGSVAGRGRGRSRGGVGKAVAASDAAASSSASHRELARADVPAADGRLVAPPDRDTWDQDSNVCLFTIMTSERVASLHRMLDAWDGWCSIALLVDDYEAAAAQGLEVLSYRGRLPPAPRRLALTIVEDRGYRKPRNRFPYNMLRNAALSRCEAEYVAAVDVDFVPFPARPSERLRRALVDEGVRAGSPNVLVLAAFEQVEKTSGGAALPTLDKGRLVDLVKAGELIPFASREYDLGHRCDHIDRFLGEPRSYEVAYEFGCEPYTVLPRAMAHAYEERFVGYGKDRVSWNYELAARGTVFRVPADVFLVHFNTYDEAPKRKAKYGHFPTDWMLGESCWSAFKDRVQSQYNFSLYSCHQLQIDGMRRGQFERCVAESEQLCVAPYCAPPQTTLRYRGGALSRTQTALTYHASPPPPPAASAAAAADEAPAEGSEPGLVLVGCDGCGGAELSRSLAATKRLQMAMVEEGEAAWRDRQVHYFDHDARFVLGDGWYRRRWPIRKGAPTVGLDGSGAYLPSADAALRLSAKLQPARVRLLLLLRDPVLRAQRRWRDLLRRAEYSKGSNFDAKMLAEAGALRRCFEAGGDGGVLGDSGGGGGGGGGALSPAVWQRCVATVCGFAGCVAGSGVYAPQVAAWAEAGRAFRWVAIPEESLHEAAAAAGLRHILASLPPPAQTPVAHLECLAAELGGELAASNASLTAGAAAPGPTAATRALRAFFDRYNAPLAPLLEKLDPAAAPLWRGVRWLPRGAEAAAAAGPAGLQKLDGAFAELRAALSASAGAGAEAGAVGGSRWFGAQPPPSALVIGSSHAGTDDVGDWLGAQPSVCAGALRVFDDDIRYMGGLPAPIGRHVSKARRQRGANTTCATFVDTTSYLPSRWAPARLRASLWARRNELRFVVVLRNPTERAVRHWRSLTYFVAHGLGVHGGRQAGKAAGKAVGKGRGLGDSRLGEYVGYTNGTTLGRKVKVEAAALGACLAARGQAGAEVSVEAWLECTAVACGWSDCVLAGGLYAPQLRHWLRHFGARQFHLLEAAQIRLEPRAVADQLAGFLKLPQPLAAVESFGAENATDSGVIGDTARRALQRFYAPYAPHVRKLFTELATPGGGWEKAPWLSGRERE